jgi:nucleoid-associated protein YgaU
MRLREAQLLGILALIAVGIILLCMWGGESGPDGALDEDQGGLVGESEWDPGLAELVERLTQEESAAAEEDDIVIEEVSVEIGGDLALPAPEPTEEAALSDLIERTEPSEIGITPVEESAPAAKPLRETDPRPRTVTHIVQKGDTLSEISQKYYGTSRRWRQIAKANAGIDPNRLQVGMELSIPAVKVVAVQPPLRALSAAADAASEAQRTYTVQKGDNLFRIAVKCYDDGTRWKDIQSANRQTVPDADSLRPGMVLVIP